MTLINAQALRKHYLSTIFVCGRFRRYHGAGPCQMTNDNSSIDICQLFDPPPVYGAAVEEFFGCDHAVLFEDHSVLHHELDVSDDVDVLERIAANCDHVGGKSGFDWTALLVD